MIILVLITILIDYLLIYFIPSYFNNINFLYPMLTITLIVYLYKKTDNKKYFKTVFLTGLLYDIVFSYIFLFNSLIFLMFAKIIKKLDRYFRINLVISLILVVLFIFLYDLVLFILVYISNYNSVSKQITNLPRNGKFLGRYKRKLCSVQKENLFGKNISSWKYQYGCDYFPGQCSKSRRKPSLQRDFLCMRRQRSQSGRSSCKAWT